MAIAETVHANLEILQGRLPDAIARLRNAMTEIAKNRYRVVGGGAALGVGLASAFYENDQLPEVERLLIEALPLVKEAGAPETLIPSHLLLARCARARGENDLALQRLADLELFGHTSSLPRLVATVWIERSKWALQDGANEAAQEYLEHAASYDQVWAQVKAFPAGATDCNDLVLATLRLQVRTGRFEEALPVLKSEMSKAEASRRRMRAALLKLLHAEALEGTGQHRHALRQVTELLEWASTGGYVRLVADEGKAVAKLLLDARPVDAQAETSESKNEDRTLHERMLAQRDLLPNGSATAKTLDCSLKRWVSLPRACDLQRVSIGSRRHRNNHPLRPDRDYRSDHRHPR